MTPLTRCWPLLPALLVAGCEQYPEQPVFVYGQALHVDGSPLSDASLHFDRRPNLEGPSAAEEAPSPFMPYRTVSTTADGTFTLELLARDVEEQVSTDFRTYRFRVCSSSNDGQLALASFTFSAQDVELPVLRHWDAKLAVASGSKGPVVTFAPPPPATPKPPSAKLPVLFDSTGNSQLTEPTAPEPVLQLLSSGAVLWQELGVRDSWTPSPWLLEDFTAPEVQLRAVSLGEWRFEPLWGGTSQVNFRLEWRSARLPLPGGTRSARSRGATCQQWWKTGPCPWTDGQLTPTRLNEAEQASTELGLLLSTPTRLSRAVIRGLQTDGASSPQQTLIIEGSTNGSAWSRLASVPVPRSGILQPLAPFAFQGLLWAADSPVDGPLVLNGAPLFLDVPLSPTAPVRQVRLYVLDAEGRRKPLHSLAELSLFE
ncbi:hypothetical protein [Hyalangium rubrum]|uniref:Lipoprotein n=1 Tax=Hyalangium rubrum TaxID=3103134 RepID=A0ABU5HGP4_9BACT|nr:hypothetical protein [Hyalangium sp. s54d21]MDY7232002.1 hypothetical protein [Hyalangium sp. s54d21]